VAEPASEYEEQVAQAVEEADNGLRDGLLRAQGHHGTLVAAQANVDGREELRLLAAIADQIAVGLENSLLFEELRQRIFEMDALYRADEQFHQSLILDDVLKALVDSTISIIGADRGAAAASSACCANCSARPRS